MAEEEAKGLEKVDGKFKRSGLYSSDSGEPSRISEERGVVEGNALGRSV